MLSSELGSSTTCSLIVAIGCNRKKPMDHFFLYVFVYMCVRVKCSIPQEIGSTKYEGACADAA